MLIFNVGFNEGSCGCFIYDIRYWFDVSVDRCNVEETLGFYDSKRDFFLKKSANFIMSFLKEMKKSNCCWV